MEKFIVVRFGILFAIILIRTMTRASISNSYRSKISMIGMKGLQKTYLSSVYEEISREKNSNQFKVLLDRSDGDTLRIVSPRVIQTNVIRFDLLANRTTPKEEIKSVNVICYNLKFFASSIRINLALIRSDGSSQFWKDQDVQPEDLQIMGGYGQRFIRLRSEYIKEWQRSYLPVGTSLSVTVTCKQTFLIRCNDFLQFKNYRVAIVSVSPSISLDEVNHRGHYNFLNRVRRSAEIKRQKSGHLEEDDFLSVCKQHSYMVNLDTLNWSPHILFPRKFTMNYCRGGCKGLSFNFETSTNHALLFRYLELIQPHSMKRRRAACCSPLEYEDMPVLLFINHEVILKVFPNNFVKTCGCH